MDTLQLEQLLEMRLACTCTSRSYTTNDQFAAIKAAMHMRQGARTIVLALQRGVVAQLQCAVAVTAAEASSAR